MNSKKILVSLFTLVLCLSSSVFAQLAAPTELTITSSGGNVVLNWNAVVGATSYNVYKDVTNNVDISFPYATTGATSYADPLDAGTKYFYVVNAIVPTGTLSGTVRDTSGVVFGGVLVEAVNQGNPNFVSRGYTLSDGTYNFSDVPVGTYNVRLYRYLRPVQNTVASVLDAANTTLDHQFANFAWVTVPAGTIFNQTWVNTNVYQLLGAVTVDSTDALNIQEGTTIVGNYPSISLLIIHRGATLNSNGSKWFPVVFTSNRAEGSRATADWGGIVVNGNAQENRGTVPNGEGDSGPFGRADTLYNGESSGTIVYTRLEFSGFRFSATNELNSLCLQGVGRGTTVHHYESIGGADDGIEFFGGTVNVHHLAIVDGNDDGFDWTDGWQGQGHHVLVRTRADVSDRAIEADNYEFGNDFLPRAKAQLSNFTMIGKQGNAAGGAEGDNMVLIRRGTAALLYNSIITLGRASGIDIDDSSTAWNASSAASTPNGEITLNNLILWDNGPVATEVIDASTGAGIGDGHFVVENAEWQAGPCLPTNAMRVNTIHIAAPTGWTQDLSGFRGCGNVGTNATNLIADPLLVNPIGTLPTFDPRPAVGSPALNPSNAAGALPVGLPVVPYVGAFSGPGDNWLEGWTYFPAN